MANSLLARHTPPARHSGAATRNPESRVVRVEINHAASAHKNTSTFAPNHHHHSSGFRFRLRRPGMTARGVVAQKQEAK